MQFCTEHWGHLREAIDSRCLNSLVAESGEQVVRNLTSELADGQSIDNFDPLMAAHNMILANAMDCLKNRYGQSPLVLMIDDPDRPQLACPICALNYCHEQHDLSCKAEGCDWPKGERYEWMIERAASGALEAWKEMRP